jgi:hypothetical protein
VNPLVSYKLNPFTVFFLGSSHTFLQSEPGAPGSDGVYRQTERTYFIKLQYLIRV